jgi:hypothetical protein
MCGESHSPTPANFNKPANVPPVEEDESLKCCSELQCPDRLNKMGRAVHQRRKLSDRVETDHERGEEYFGQMVLESYNR